MATTIKEDKAPKEKRSKDTTVDDVIIDEKIVLLRDFFQLVLKQSKTEDC
jgi:hypothetical protein